MAAALLLAALPAATAAAAGPATITVKPGQSIQAAVDRAKSGDTVKIAAGTYTEAVCISGKGLTVVGAGAGKTVISYPQWGTGKPLQHVTPNICWKAQEQADAQDNPDSVDDDVSALFFLKPDGPVKVSDLSTRNHPASGIVAWGARGFDVHNTSGLGHERYGILAAASKNISLSNNKEQGTDRGAPWFSGNSGVSVADSPAADASIVGNTVQGYNLGVFVRETRDGRITGNLVTGNCIGILFFDDSATEIPNTNGHVDGGNFLISKNTSNANNRYCISGRDNSQFVSGVGISVTNADHVAVDDNVIKNNHPVVPAGAQPINYPPGGLSLLTFAPPPGSSPPGAILPGAVSYVRVTGNQFTNNQPVDIFVTRPIPNSPLGAPGPLAISGNTCSVSSPGGYC